jgi:hypothetical protein
MAYEQKPGTFSLWKNDRARNDNDPTMTGTLILPDGTECWINAWGKNHPERGKWMSGNIKVKQPRPEQAHTQRMSYADRKDPPPTKRSWAEALDDELPPF